MSANANRESIEPVPASAGDEVPQAADGQFSAFRQGADFGGGGPLGVPAALHPGRCCAAPSAAGAPTCGHRAEPGASRPCRVVLASPYEVLGAVRQPNLPGTTDQYPNWRIPLPSLLEDLTADARMHQIADLFSA